MKTFLLCAMMLCLVAVSFGQDGKKIKEFTRLLKEDSGIDRGNVINALKKYFEMQSDDELLLLNTEKDQLNFLHDKYQQYFKGVKVDGAVYSAHSINGIVESYSGEFKGIKDFDITPGIPAILGLKAAIEHVGAKVYAWDPGVKGGYPDYDRPSGELVIIGGAPNDNLDLTLAWKFDIYAVDPLYRAEVFIDAKTGEFIKENQLLYDTNVSASGITLYNSTRTFMADQTAATSFRLRQTTSGGGIQTYTLKNGTSYLLASDITSTSATSWSDKTAIQAHWGAEQTWSYYNAKHGRNSFNNAGAIIKSYVHYSKNYVNAFWDGSRMTYGDGDGVTYGPLVSLDICGHEITHGVTTYSANLTYSNESGALNESFSDIFGECIENYAKGTNDWLMGCDIGLTGCGAFRSMANPNLYGDPDTYKGTNWYTGTGDNGGVHYNSGVQNKWFYILCKGESGTNDKGLSYNVTGIGMEKAAKISYRNLTVYLTASSDYAAARAGSIKAATDIYGATSTETIATGLAWDAVGVYAPGPDVTPPSAPTLSSSSITQNSVVLSWTAATDNIAVTGYDLYINDVLTVSNTTSRSYTATGLTASTTFTIYVYAKDAAGNKTKSNVLTVTTLGAVIETLVYGTSFETGLDSWAQSNTSNVVWTNNATYAFEGSGCVMVRSNAYATSPTINLTGYSQAELKFYFTAVGMESNKTFTLRYSSNNGSSWSTVATFTSASTASGTKFKTDNGFYEATVTMNSTSFNSTAKFRIQNGGSSTSDIIYFDKVSATGRKNTSATGTTVTLAAATKGTLKSALIPGSQFNNELILYPNPVANTLNIMAGEVVRTISIFSVNGVLISTVVNNSKTASVDMSNLSEGIYFVKVVTDDNTYINKIAK
jgi:Zn-dependent metalloprotease